jgi:hypothetical protein
MAAVRRRIIIEPHFQTSFTLSFVRGVLLSVCVPAATIFIGVLIVSNNRGLTPDQHEALLQAIRRLGTFFLLAAFIIAAISAVVGLLLSHRYAGPLKRVESWAARYLLGENVGPLKLRPGDEMVPMTEMLTRILEKAKKQ